MEHRFPIVVLISGNGSNLQAMIDAMQQGAPYQIVAVISNKADAYGLTRAEKADIATHVIDHRKFANRDQFEQQLITTIEPYQPKLIALAGFMRILGEYIVNKYQNKIINIHPSLLPKYPGLNTHRRALEARDKEHGVSIHIVTNDLDSGPLIRQAKLTIHADDTEQTLKKRIHQLEHQLYPEVLIELAKKDK